MLMTSSDRCARDDEEGGGEPRLDGQEVALAVHEHGERPQFGDVLGHESVDRLVRVEVRLRPEHEHRRADDDEESRDREERRSEVARV